MDYKDYYQILGVSKTADEKEIKKAYRKLARQYHPDVNPGDAATEAKFKDINEAYEVLSDPENRKMYDKFGSQWKQYQRAGGGSGDDFWQQWQAQQGARPGGYTSRTVSPEEFEQMFGGRGGSGFSSFFESLFGGQGRRAGSGGFDFTDFTSGQQRQARPQRGRDIEQPVQITLEEAFHGTSRQMQWEDGRTITAKIPRGAKTGTRVRLKGKGGSAPGGQAGDLYLKVETLPHAKFERVGDDLKVTVPVDMYTAVLGGKVPVPTIDKTVSLTIPPGTSSGKTFRLRGLGMPNLKNPDKRGDLLATVEVTVPQNLSDKEKELFRQLQEMRSQTQ
ncbi:MAG TPA: J domain-containing protein [Anaerolineae bacterium]|nr:J domain-containing protein [Anaerolineae bacterium]